MAAHFIEPSIYLPIQICQKNINFPAFTLGPCRRCCQVGVFQGVFEMLVHRLRRGGDYQYEATHIYQLVCNY